MDVSVHCMLVTEGCCCVSWIMAGDNVSTPMPVHPKEVYRLIGVILLQVGEEMVYSATEELPGFEVVEAAMLQAIKLENTKAIEILLAAGCNPEVAIYNGDHAVTNVVNIRARSAVDSGEVV